MTTKRHPFSNRYVFAKVMRERPDLCKAIIERALGVEVGRVQAVEPESEQTSITHRSVRFDVFMRGDGASFEVEMQTYEQTDLPRRGRRPHGRARRCGRVRASRRGVGGQHDDARRDIQDAREYAVAQGRKEGIEQGRAEGIEQGEAAERARIENVMRDQGLSEDLIAKILSAKD